MVTCLLNMDNCSWENTEAKFKLFMADCTQNPWSSGRLQILLILCRFEVVLIQPYLFSFHSMYAFSWV